MSNIIEVGDIFKVEKFSNPTWAHRTYRALEVHKATLGDYTIIYAKPLVGREDDIHGRPAFASTKCIKI